LSITFLVIILVPVFLYLTNSPLLYIGGDLLLQLIRSVFIMIATPIVIITLFVGHRIDDTRNKVTPYPMWVELTGLISGIFLGWTISAGWSFLLLISIGTIWSDPFLYAPFPIFTALITYLCFKGAQFIYKLKHKSRYRDSFKVSLFFFIMSLPVLLYTVMAFTKLIWEESIQNEVTITNLKEFPMENGYMVTADLSAPDADLYHITASVGQTPHATLPLALKVNGTANLDGLYNFELNKGVNQVTYVPNIKDCAFTEGQTISSTITFNINKVFAGRFIIGLPHQITLPITCH
jgi:hypothetical protein